MIVDGGDGDDVITLEFTTAAAGLSTLTVQGGAGADTLLITKIVSGVTYAPSSMTLAVENFFPATGDFTIRKTSATVTLSDRHDDRRCVDGRWNNVSAFVGLNGGTANEVGLSLTGLTLDWHYSLIRATPHASGHRCKQARRAQIL